VVTRGRRKREGNRMVVRRYKLPVIREVGTGDVMSNMMTIVKIVLYGVSESC